MTHATDRSDRLRASDRSESAVFRNETPANESRARLSVDSDVCNKAGMSSRREHRWRIDDADNLYLAPDAARHVPTRSTGSESQSR